MRIELCKITGGATAMSLSNSHDVIVLLWRLLLVWIFIRAGYGKLLEMGAFAGGMAKRGVPYPEAFPYMAVAIELVGGVLLLLGFLVRPLSVLMILFVIAATYIAHQYWTYPPEQQVNQANHFFKNLAIIGGFLALYASGGGRYSLDALRSREPAAA